MMCAEVAAPRISDAAFFLDCADIEDLIGVEQRAGAAASLLASQRSRRGRPRLCQIAVIGEDFKIGDRGDRIARRNTQGFDIGGVARSGCLEKFLLLGVTLRVVRSDVRIPNVGNRGDWPL